MLEFCVFLIVTIAICVAANYKGRLRWISVSIVAIIALPILGLVLWFVSMGMELEGVWPFPRLNSLHKERRLENGGTLVFDEKESRTFGKGPYYTDSLGYRPPGSDQVEPLASETREAWGPWTLEEVEAYLIGDLVVVLTPSDFFVRSLLKAPAQERPAVTVLDNPDESPALHTLSSPSVDERWQRLNSRYSDGRDTFAGDYKDELLKIRTEIAEADHGSPTAKVVRFDPKTRNLRVAISEQTWTRYLYLQLSEDGTSLSLVKD